MPTLLGDENYRHGGESRIGVLLANLGTPDAPTAKAVRRYLREFLSDPRVIESPRWLWQIVLNAIILPIRSPRSAALYRKIWTDEGSPLLVISQKIARALQAKMDSQNSHVKVELGMRYGSPSIASALRELKKANCRRLLILPLYPQYASSTVGSVFDAVAAELSTWRWTPPMRFVSGYANLPAYADALADSISAHWKKNGKPDSLLFSFHGTPLISLSQGDPYFCQCQMTARLAADRLQLQDDEWTASFQSRFGPAEWLQPYTEDALKKLADDGKLKVDVICPAFSADCLETLEEIAIGGREIFLSAGGKDFAYIPSLNDSPRHINFLFDLTAENIRDWLVLLADETDSNWRRLQKSRAEKFGGN